MSDTNPLNEENFPSNSKVERFINKPRKKKPVVVREVEPVRVEEEQTVIVPRAKAIRRRKSLVEKITGSLINESSRGVGNYILNDVLIPAAKDTIRDMVSNGIEMALFGTTGGRGSSRRRETGSHVSYNSYYSGRERERDDRRPVRTRGGAVDLDEILFRHPHEAKDVLEEMCNTLEKYDQITVADYLELAGVDGGTHADRKWGWENLQKAYCAHVRGGYTIVLPPPIELD